MFVDEASIIVKAGHGGPGRVSFHRPPMRGPDGGNGGKGGDVYVVGTTDLMALRQFSVKDKIVSAQSGETGGANQKFGKDGKDITIRVPKGTIFTNQKTGQEFEITDTDKPVRIARGGLGGRGNAQFKSSTNTTPQYAQPGLSGEEFYFVLNLKLIADFGLIGLPNAGKSSLLNELTAANVKTAAYPFTTLEPNLGVFEGKIIADIPGLIEGASSGKGLGIKFLKHIEKVKTLIHCISCENSDFKKAYETIRKELARYNSSLLSKKEVILITKSDLQGTLENKKAMEALKKPGVKIIPVSIYDDQTLKNLKKVLNDSHQNK